MNDMRKLTIVLLLLASTTAFADKVPGWLGLGYTYHRNPDGTGWLHVQRLAPGGPAEKAGLLVQNVITAIDGKPLRFADDKAVIAHFKSIRPGQEVVLTVMQRGKAKPVKVKAIAMPKQYYELWKQNEQRAKEKN